MIKSDIIGRLTRDPVIRNAGSSNLCSLAIAADGRGGRNEERPTLYFDISWFGAYAERMAAILKKGSQVYVSGDFGIRTYKSRDGEEKTSYTITADKVVPIGAPPQNAANRAQPSTKPAPAPAPDDDDLPF